MAGEETSAGEPPAVQRLDTPTRGAPASKPAHLLEQHAGFVLIIVGAGLIALAAVLADRPAVAPLLVVFGAGMVILGCFYSRIEGAVEASKDGIRTVVREIDRLAVEQDIPADTFPELIEEAIDLFEPSSRRPQEVRRAAREAAEQTVKRESSLAFQREQRFMHFFGAWLEGQGWTVTGHNTVDFGFDMLATKASEELAVVVKVAARPISGERVGQVIASPDILRRKKPNRRVALVVPAEPGVTFSGLTVARHFRVEVYGVSDRGDVERLD